jgi:hypothetical protein
MGMNVRVRHGIVKIRHDVISSLRNGSGGALRAVPSHGMSLQKPISENMSALRKSLGALHVAKKTTKGKKHYISL